MAFTCALPVAVLRRLIDRATKVIPRRATIPVLSHVKIEAAEDGRVTLTGTDLDCWISVHAPTGTAQVEQPGLACLPGALLSDIVKRLPEGSVKITAGNARATVAGGRSRFQLNVLPAEDFPDTKELLANAVRFDLQPAQLKRINDAVGFAISTEETRYYLNGIYFHEDQGRLVTVATDGHRLSRLVQDVGSSIEGLRPAIVPRETVKLFGLVADSCDDDEAISVDLDEARMRFETHDLVLVSKLIDGTFPDYQRVIPKENPHCAALAREAVIEAVDRVQTVSADKGRAVKLTWTADELRLRVQSAETGEGEDSAPADWNGPDGFEIGFNSRYLHDALGTFSSAQISIALAQPGDPALITDATDESRLVVLMPMRVS